MRSVSRLQLEYHIGAKNNKKAGLDYHIFSTITSSPEVHQNFKIWTVQKPDVFLPGCRTLTLLEIEKKCIFSDLFFQKIFRFFFYNHLQLLTPNLCPGTFSYEN